jgi:hypothetical protein
MARGTPKLVTRLVKQREARTALAISRESFRRHWDSVFTDPRSAADRRAGVERCVYEDELAVAVEYGGRMGARAKAAVLAYRRTVGRTSWAGTKPL